MSSERLPERASSLWPVAYVAAAKEPGERGVCLFGKCWIIIPPRESERVHTPSDCYTLRPSLPIPNNYHPSSVSLPYSRYSPSSKRSAPGMPVSPCAAQRPADLLRLPNLRAATLTCAAAP